MANIFKTTLKKEIIADIADNNKREVRFPITKFWASRLSDKYNLADKTFEFKSFDSLELSSPSNKETGGVTYTFEFVRTYIDGDEFVIEFKEDEKSECCMSENITDELEQVDLKDVEMVIPVAETPDNNEIIEEHTEYLDSDVDEDIEIKEDQIDISNDEIFTIIDQWFEEEGVLDTFYKDEYVFATNAKQVIVLPNGKVLGFKKSLPLNNDVEVRIEFDMNNRLYFDSTSDFEEFKDEILNMLSEIRKNNFVFIWKRYTGIFMDNDGRIYFDIKYSTRKTFGFENRYNVQ